MADPVVPLTLDDTSPLVAYAPWGDPFGPPHLNLGWAPYYSLSGFASDPGPSSSGALTDLGNGTSLHLTACDGAQLAVSWNGTAITLYGTLTPDPDTPAALAYTVALDGVATTNYISQLSPAATLAQAPTDILAAFGTLDDAPHQLVLTVHNSAANASTGAGAALLAFDRAALWMDASGSALPLPSTTTYLPPAAPTVSTTAVPDAQVGFSGEWDYAKGLLPGDPAAAFHTSTNVGDSARVSFLGTAVSLAGLTTPNSGAYNVTLDNRTTTYSARASFTAGAPTVLFYAADLDPRALHELEIVNAGPLEGYSGQDSGALLVVLANGVNTTMSSGGPSSTSAMSTTTTLPRGTVAALAVGTTLAFAALCVLIGIAVWWRRRRATQRKRELIMHPRVHGGLRALLGFRRGTRTSAADDPEAAPREKAKARDSAFGVPARGAGFPDSEDDEFEFADPPAPPRAPARVRHPYAAPGPGTLLVGHAAQNSDGSFSIDLPELSPVPEGLPRSSFPSTARPAATESSLATAGEPPSPPRSGSGRTSTRPRGPRQMTQHGRNSSRGILLSHAATPSSDADAGEGEGAGAPPPASLRVEFAQGHDRPERGERERYVSAGAMSLPQSLRQALVRSAEVLRRLEEGEEGVPPGGRPSAFSSFLSLTASSSSGSRSRRSSATRSASTRSSRSRRSERSEPTDPRASLGMTMRIEGGPTPSRPELTPEISLQTVQLPEPPEPASPGDRAAIGAGGLLPSPTESYPHTLSDIHFRHSTYSTSSFGTAAGAESRRTSAIRTSNSHRPPPHPPLPSTMPNTPNMPTHSRSQSQQQRSYIVQKLMGMQVAGTELLTPYGSPNPAPSSPAPSAPGTTAGAGPSIAAHARSSSAGAGPSMSGGRAGTPSSLPVSPSLAQFVLGRKPRT